MHNSTSDQNNLSILLVEDNPDIAENIAFYLKRKGHSVVIKSMARQAMTLLNESHFDILIFDVMLPGMNGFSLAQHTRECNIQTPIIFLTARDTLEDKREGFSMGADDYLTKPFDLEELEMRINALYRRDKGVYKHSLSLYGWCVNEQRLEITFNEKILNSTNIGFKILKLLIYQYPEIISRRDMENKIWGNTPPNSDSLRSHIFSLRKSISIICDSTFIETVHGIGFRLIIKK